jgi:biotin carboxyl carrier protein
MKALVNKREIKIEKSKTENSFSVNGTTAHFDIVKVEEGFFHVLHNNKSFRARVLENDATQKTFTIKINSNNYKVAIKDKYDELLHALGLDTMLSNKINDLKAPMPGLVLSILVEEGAEIKKGDNLLVLEAMKMENILKATADAKVKKVRATIGARVEKNEVLIELE